MGVRSDITQAFDGAASTLGAAITTGAVSLSVVASTKKVVRTTGSFVNDGFYVGRDATLSGFSKTANNQTALITAVSALELTFALATFEDETAAAGKTVAAEALTIAYPNMSTTPPAPATKRWLAVWNIPTSTERATIGVGGFNQYEGIYQISIFDPTGNGPGPSVMEADRIASTFYIGRTLTIGTTNVQITAVHQERAIFETDWYHIPVSIHYRAISQS